MELSNEFRVGVSVPEAWKVLTDVERIAPMLPGAQLQEVEGDEYRGVVKVKVGPISAQYKGQATFVERDEDAGRVVLKASGRDTRGQGNASALITATMLPDGDGTKVSVVTDLTITGKVAQFGRGVLAEVSAKLIGQFVNSLEADLAASGEPAQTTEVAGNGAGPESETTTTEGSVAGNGAATAGGVRVISGPDAEPVDLMAVGGGSVMKRLGPVLVAGVVILVVLALRRRLRH
jgi:carbon monoxide dehydrogenase subunit G